MNRRKHAIFSAIVTTFILLGLVFSSTVPVLAAGNDNNVEWPGAGHIPGNDICGDANFPYRNPQFPRADQSVTLRARIYWQDLTGLTFWYTTNPLATTQSDWTSVAAVWEANWWGCGGLGDMDIYVGSIPAQTSTVWYKVAYTDGTDTDWQRGPGEGGTGMYEDDGGWATGSTSLTYAPPATVYVDDDFDGTTPGWDYDHFDTISNGFSAVATGGTINVADGSYSAGAAINRSVTIQGAGTGNTVVQGADAGQGFSITNGTENVSISDLTVRNFQDGFVLGTATGAITNVVLTDVETILNTRHGIFSNAALLTDITLTRANASNNGIAGSYGRGLFFQATGAARNNITITDGVFSDNNLVGIDFNIGQATDITITGNAVENNGDAGIGLLGAFSALIDNNTLTDNGRFGIEIKNPDGDGTLNGTNRFVVSNNNVSMTGPPASGSPYDMAGIAVFRRDVVLANGNPDIPSGVIVTGNTVSGYQQTTNDGFGIVVEGTEMRVYNNTLNNNDIGVQQQAGNDGYPGNSEQTLTNDYFSRGNSPTTCADIGTNTYSGNTIDYRAVGTLGTPDVLNTDTNVNFCSIQAAIDDSTTLDTHTIQVSAGTYVENVRIHKSVTLAGAGQANTTIIPAVSNPAPCADSSLCGTATAASNIILIEASDVVVHDLTLDGDNPLLTSGITCGGADIDARNGIIENYYSGTLHNLEVYNTTIQNIYLRGLYLSSQGDGFNVHNNIVDNVQCDVQSIAIMNFGGSGIFQENTVSNSNGGIVTNWSRGTQILMNTVNSTLDGIHSDNNGNAAGSTPDLLQGNTVNCPAADGYGVWVFAPFLAVTVQQNTVNGCAVGLAAARSNGATAPTPVFVDNNVDGQSLTGSVGAYITTEGFGWGSADVSASFTNNTIQNTADGFFIESQTGNTLDANIADNTITTVSSGVAITSTGTANIVVKGNDIDGATTVFSGSLNTNYTLNAYANNIINFGDGGLTSATGTFNARRNWWGTYATQPTGVDTDSWDYRLGADVHTWADGVDSAALGSASLSGGSGTAVIVGHGRGLANAPFGNGIEPYVSSICSEFYDFFVAGGSGTWQVQVPVDGGTDCDDVRTNNGLAFIEVGTYDVNCDTPTNSACWELAPNVSNSGTHLISSGLSVSDLGGTQFVAGAPDAPYDPTVVQLHSLKATRASNLVLPLSLGLLLLAGASLLMLQRRRS